ncbi:MAG: hypothetical protein QGG54_16785 [Gammaproteobacteria bacterium]|nr:hypothetical protein [Gammaproteobacteria bacterium]MDP6535214.1 hypothetical protein [Gammaproteobacteria bacterium]MDP6731168.1 hypothetical protein [Gammaproteobacteria bacterium]
MHSHPGVEEIYVIRGEFADEQGNIEPEPGCAVLAAVRIRRTK